jgi:TonB-linked SusC/RagA family outer membrane protein
MKNLKYFILICCLAIASAVSAQGITSISGTVSDSFGPVMGAAVVEQDGSNRNISATVTDMNGNFTLKIKNPKNKLKISFVGLKTQVLPINKRVYKIMLEENVVAIKDVTVTAKRIMETSGLAIPEREVSFAAQTIDAKEFEGLGLTSVDEALQGRISGLDIVANSGNLGSGTSMRLRGASTISTVCSTEPLIVVNGDVWNVDQTDFDVNTANDEKFAQLLNINPEDIQKISVLKDAAATAIWGSQGANGVIEITTKRGHRGKPRLTYSCRLTATYQPDGVDLLTGDQYTMLLKEAYFNPQQNDAAANIPEISYLGPTGGFSEWQMFNNNTDWVKEVKQVGLRQNHYISVTGGDDKAVFRISGGYDRETGSIIEQQLDRFSTRLALDYYVSDRIKIISDFSLTYTDNQRNSDDLLSIAYRKMPNLAIYEEDANGNSTGRYYQMLQSDDKNVLNDQRGLVNPLASAEYAVNRYKTYAIDPKLELQYDLLGVDDTQHRLTYNGRVVMNVWNAYTDTYYPRELSTKEWNADVSKASTASNKSLAFTTTHTLTFVPHFNNEDHSLMAMGRFQLVSGTSSDQSTNVSGLPNGIEAPSAGNINPGMSSGFGQWRSMYYTFSTHYAYKSRYMFDVSVRMDGTTKFGPSKRWGVFPAVSGRWNIIDEPWMEGTRKWLSMLSIRPGWGLVGNQPTADYLYVNQYGTDNVYLGSSAMKPNNLKLTTLRWESKYTWNVGFDLGFFNNKLTMDINLYTQTTKDMLMGNVRIPSISGFSTLSYMNVGDMNNKGWEFNILGNKLIEKGKFSMDMNITFANNRNVITKMDPIVLETLNNDWVPENAKLLQRVQIDNPFGAIYGFRYKGVYSYNYDSYEKALAEGKTAPIVYNANGEIIRDQNGDPLQMKFNYGEGSEYNFKGGDAIYEDVNHDGNINQLDIVYLGNSLPKLTGGFGFKFNYGRWSLNAQFNYRIDYDVVNMARLNMESMTSNNNQSQAVNYRWRKEGDVTSIPRALIGNQGIANYNTMISDRFVEDGTFLRLNYLQLSYSFPQNMVKKIGLNELRFYASANNLFCLTKYSGVDPELGYGGYGVTTDNAQTPRAKSYTFGITVGF